MTKAWRSGVERIWRYHSEYACICIVFSPSSFLSDPRQAYASDCQGRWVRWCYCWSVLVLIRSHVLLNTVINDRFERFRMTIDGNEIHCSAMWWDSMTTRQSTVHYRRLQQQELAPALVLVGGNGQDTRAIHRSSRLGMVHPSAFVPNGPRLVVVATLGWRNSLCDLMMMMVIDGNNANASIDCSRQSLLLPVIICYVGWKRKKNWQISHFVEYAAAQQNLEHSWLMCWKMLICVCAM